MTRDDLGDRMKCLERMHRHVLPPRLPAIIRVDGKAFHTYTRTLKANDPNMMAAMCRVAEALCNEIMGARLAYTQSDECSVLVNPWSSQNSQAWFDGQLQKICSVAASIAAATMTAQSTLVFGEVRPAYFDARVFTLHGATVHDYFVWRQLDASRNALNSHAHEHFSHTQLNKKSAHDVRAMLNDAGYPFAALPSSVQRGQVTLRQTHLADGVVRQRWASEAAPWFAAEPDSVQRLASWSTT